MEGIARRLEGIASEVRVYEPKGLPKGGGAADHPAVRERDLNALLEGWYKAPVLSSSSSRPLVENDDDDGALVSLRGLRLVSFASVPRPPDERPAVIEGLIPQRFPSIIFGDGGTAKSLLAASLLQDVSRGAEEWLGHRIRQQGPTIYLDFELDQEEQARRVYQLAEGARLGGPPEDFHYLSGAGLAAGHVLEDTLELAEKSGAVLVLLDSLGFALEGDAETSRDVLRFVRQVHQALQDRRHHASHRGPSG